MNFKKLQEMQRALDDAILKEKPEMREVERLNKTFIALSVEIAELANTAEHFKFWKDNKGKIDSKRFRLVEYQDIGIFYEDLGVSDQKAIVKQEQAHKLTLVEEASDCLHFILSSANQLHEELDELVDLERDLPEWVDTKDSCYKELLWCVADRETTVDTILVHFMKYVKELGITQEELEQAYYDKNEINYQRLREGY